MLGCYSKDSKIELVTATSLYGIAPTHSDLKFSALNILHCVRQQTEQSLAIEYHSNILISETA